MEAFEVTGTVEADVKHGLARTTSATGSTQDTASTRPGQSPSGSSSGLCDAPALAALDDPKPSYGDYLRVAQQQHGKTPQLAAKSPACSNVATPGVRPRVQSVVSMPGPSPTLSVTCEFVDQLEGFELERCVGACRGCGKSESWVVVECFYSGSEQCCCRDATWELCEQCCTDLLHDVCLAKQVTEPSPVLDAAKQDETDQDGAEPGGTENADAAAATAECAEYYDPNAYDGYGMCYQEEYVPTLAELQAYGADLNRLCIDFAANGYCRRGHMCSFIHCRMPN